MLFTRLFIYLSIYSTNTLPLIMIIFTISKLTFEFFFLSRISFTSLRFLVAYTVLFFKSNLTVEEFTMVFLGYGILF
jgi:hypothetical protein